MPRSISSPSKPQTDATFPPPPIAKPSWSSVMLSTNRKKYFLSLKTTYDNKKSKRESLRRLYEVLSVKSRTAKLLEYDNALDASFDLMNRAVAAEVVAAAMVVLLVAAAATVAAAAVVT